MDSEREIDSETRSKELMFEYDQLRREILQNDVMAIQISGGVFLIVSALMGFALTREGVDNLIKGSLFIVAGIAAIYGLFQTTWRVKNTRIIASYLRVHVEPHTSYLRWETRLLRHIRNPQEGKGIALLTNQGYIYTPLIVVNYLLACRFLDVAVRPDVSKGLRTILFVLGLLMIAYMVFKLWPGRGPLSYDSIWTDKSGAEGAKITSSDNHGVLERNMEDTPTEDSHVERRTSGGGMEGESVHEGAVQREGIQGAGLDHNELENGTASR
jgi:hypothetical protein